MEIVSLWIAIGRGGTKHIFKVKGQFKRLSDLENVDRGLFPPCAFKKVSGVGFSFWSPILLRGFKMVLGVGLGCWF